MKNFRTFELAAKFYKETKLLQLKGSAKDQLKRAALSIALNLAEGRARATLKDQKKFFNIAMASARESQAVLILEDLEDTKAWIILDKLAASVYCLIKYAR